MQVAERRAAFARRAKGLLEPDVEGDGAAARSGRGAVVVDPVPVVFEPLPFAEELGACVGLRGQRAVGALRQRILPGRGG
mgnify:CR=1 FL=1